MNWNRTEHTASCCMSFLVSPHPNYFCISSRRLIAAPPVRLITSLHAGYHPMPFHGNCIKCGKYGHRAADCPIAVYTFHCSCGNTFSGWCEGLSGSATCYECNRKARPVFRLPRGLGKRKSSNTHSCNRCNGSGNCPIAGR